MMAETHLSPAAFAKLTGSFEAWNRRPFHANARPSGRSEGGTSGGTLVAPKLSTALDPISKGIGAERWFPKSSGEDWTFVVVRTCGLSYVAIGAYLEHSIGPV